MKNHTLNTSPCSASPDDVERFQRHMRRAVSLISGKWKLEILWLLNGRTHRFNELRRHIPGITQHMLTMQLRELETDGLVQRTVYAEVPPRVEYRITDEAQRLRPVFEAIFAWAGECSSEASPVNGPCANLV